MTYFITGASSGIGKELARQLVEKGHRVFGCGRSDSRLQELNLELGERAQSFAYAAFDLGDERALYSAVEMARAKFGEIDVVVANAGFRTFRPMDQLELDEVRSLFEVNVFGAFATIKACLPDVVRRKGQIVLMGSMETEAPLPNRQPYGMTKAALKNLATTLYHEMKAQGVSVTLLTPGVVESAMRRRDMKGELNPEVSDPAPAWLKVATHTAVKEMIKAIECRRKHSFITFHARVIALIFRFCPTLISFAYRRTYEQ